MHSGNFGGCGLEPQNDMFRLTYAMELLMGHARVYQAISNRDWTGRHRIQTSASVNSICLLKSALDIAFNEEGKQIQGLILLLLTE